MLGIHNLFGRHLLFSRITAFWARVPLLMALISMLGDKVPAVPGPICTALATWMFTHLIWKYFSTLINSHMQANEIATFILTEFCKRQMLHYCKTG